MNTRELARTIEQQASWTPVGEVFDEYVEELRTNNQLGYGPWTVDILTDDQDFWVCAALGTWTHEHGPDIAKEFEMGPFHSIERARRRGIIFIASIEALEDEAAAYYERIMNEGL